jgi:hypothetical protein
MRIDGVYLCNGSYVRQIGPTIVSPGHPVVFCFACLQMRALRDARPSSDLCAEGDHRSGRRVQGRDRTSHSARSVVRRERKGGPGVFECVSVRKPITYPERPDLNADLQPKAAGRQGELENPRLCPEICLGTALIWI